MSDRFINTGRKMADEGSRRYGVLVLVASFLNQFITTSVYLCYAVLMVEFSEVFSHSKAVIAGAVSVESAVYHFSGEWCI